RPRHRPERVLRARRRRHVRPAATVRALGPAVLLSPVERGMEPEEPGALRGQVAARRRRAVLQDPLRLLDLTAPRRAHLPAVEAALGPLVALRLLDVSPARPGRRGIDACPRAGDPPPGWCRARQVRAVTCAQTNLQLYGQLLALGHASADVAAVAEAYE